MADMSDFVALASAKLRQIAAEMETSDALQEQILASKARLILLQADLSLIEADTAEAGISVADLHAECEEPPMIKLSAPVEEQPAAPEPEPAPSEPEVEEPAPEAPVADEATNI